MASKKKNRRFKNFAKARSRDTLYSIPAGTEIIKFLADNVTGEILQSCSHIEGPKVKVFNGSFLIKVGYCDCGCGDELMLFQFAKNEFATLVYQVNSEDVLVCSRREYDALQQAA